MNYIKEFVKEYSKIYFKYKINTEDTYSYDYLVPLVANIKYILNEGLTIDNGYEKLFGFRDKVINICEEDICEYLFNNKKKKLICSLEIIARWFVDNKLLIREISLIEEKLNNAENEVLWKKHEIENIINKSFPEHPIEGYLDLTNTKGLIEY